jgi:hypothetical protein
MDRAERWLHQERHSIGEWRDDGEAVAIRTETALAGVDALEAAAVLDSAAAADWWRVLSAEAAGGAPVTVDAQIRERAQRFLEAALETLPRDPEWDDPAVQRFEAAVHMLGAVGAIDRRAWGDRFREHVGWPAEEVELAEEAELNAGGTERELLGVVPGPAEARGGYRLVLMLRFTDGLSFLIDKDSVETADIEWPDWRLADDAGTSYWGGGGGGHDEENLSFRMPVPPQSRWVELSLESRPDVRFRVSLD